MIDAARGAAERDAKNVGALVVVVVIAVLALGGSCGIGVVLGFFLRSWS